MYLDWQWLHKHPKEDFSNGSSSILFKLWAFFVTCVQDFTSWEKVWEANRQLISQHLLSTSAEKKWSPVSRKAVELCNDDTEMVNMQAIKNDELI